MYDVALLIERQLKPLDADQVAALHEGLDEPVAYHLLLPVETSSAGLMTSMTALGGGQVIPIGETDALATVEDDLRRAGQDELDASAELLRTKSAHVTAELTEGDPVDALKALVASTGAAEAIILTEPHVLKDFLHLDWTSRARRALDVPTLHLLEHLTFDAQAEG